MISQHSVGDVLLLSQTAWKVGRAFSADSKRSPPGFAEVHRELESLSEALQRLAEILHGDNGFPIEADHRSHQSDISTILDNVTKDLGRLEGLVERYQVFIKRATAGGSVVERTWSDVAIANYTTLDWTVEGGSITELSDLLRTQTDKITLAARTLERQSTSPLKEVAVSRSRQERSTIEPATYASYALERPITNMAMNYPQYLGMPAADSSTFSEDRAFTSTSSDDSRGHFSSISSLQSAGFSTRPTSLESGALSWRPSHTMPSRPKQPLAAPSRLLSDITTRSFEEQLFRNAAILCDVRGAMVEYAQHISNVSEPRFDTDMTQACESCRICVIRKRAKIEPLGTKVLTSVWIFSDDDQVRCELLLPDWNERVPYASYFEPRKVSIPPFAGDIALIFHGSDGNSILEKEVKTNWVNCHFQSEEGAVQFQSAVYGRTLLGSFRTTKTTVVHDGLRAAFASEEQLASTQVLRLWEDDGVSTRGTGRGVLALLNLSEGSARWWMNSSKHQVRVKEGTLSNSLRIRGIEVHLLRRNEIQESSKGRGAAQRSKAPQKKITGVQIHFKSEEERAKFVSLARLVRGELVNLPDLDKIELPGPLQLSRPTAESALPSVSPIQRSTTKQGKIRQAHTSDAPLTPSIGSSFRFLPTADAIKSQQRRDAREMEEQAEVAPSPAKQLDAALAVKNADSVERLIRDHFEQTATGSWAWLSECRELGYSKSEIVNVLLEDMNDAPWIYFEPWADSARVPQVGRHIPGCVHTGGRLSSTMSGGVGLDERVEPAPGICSEELDSTQDLCFSAEKDMSQSDLEHAETTRHESIPTAGLTEKSNARASRSEHDIFLGVEEDERSIQDTVESLCGLAGVAPCDRDDKSWVGQVFFETDHMACVTYRTGDNSGRATLARIKTALSAYCSAAEYLQIAGYCCDSFTMLCHRGKISGHDRPVTELCAVGFQLALDLLGCVNRALNGGAQLDLADCEYCATLVLAVVAEGHLYETPDATQDEKSCLDICALAAQILCLGLLSYTQAHTGPLRPFFLVHHLSEVRLYGTGDSAIDRSHVTVRLDELSCVGAMLRDSVWVFHAHRDRRPIRFVKPSNVLDVLASPEDFVDTWGPGNFAVLPNTMGEARITSIHIGGGSISRVLGRDRLYHWSSDSLADHSDLSTISAREKVIIGAVVSVNTSCALVERDCLDLCGPYLDPLGSFDAYWETIEKQGGVQAGQYVNIQYNHTRGKRPGRTLKELYMLRPIDEVIAFLESPWGLQVSFCSGLTRRVKMRELMTDLIPVFVARMTNPPRQWADLCAKHNAIDNLRTGDLHQWLSDLCRQDRTFYDIVCGLVRAVTMTLQDTGIDRDWSHLKIAWIVTDPSVHHQCIKVPTESSSFWTRVLKDSSFCATYAYLTLKCLQINGTECRQSSASWHSELALMETEVLRHFGGRHDVPNEPWVIHHGDFYPIGPREHDPRTQLLAFAQCPNASEKPRLIIKDWSIPRSLMVRFVLLKRKEVRIRERLNPFDRVQTVLVTSR